MSSGQREHDIQVTAVPGLGRGYITYDGAAKTSETRQAHCDPKP